MAPTKPMQPKRLRGAALVTGGAKRIGAAICRHLAKEGARVVIHANTSGREAGELADELGGCALQADLLDPDSLGALMDQASNAAGEPIRYLVNNASQFQRTTWDAVGYTDWDRMMRLHAWAPLELTRQLADAGGRAVVNVLDTRVAGHDPQHVAYHASKQSLYHLTRSLARHWAPLRVNGVAPGPILAATDGTGNESMEASVEATVLKRQGSPQDVAEAVGYLLGAEYVTGDVVFVDGGRHVRW